MEPNQARITSPLLDTPSHMYYDNRLDEIVQDIFFDFEKAKSLCNKR